MLFRSKHQPKERHAQREGAKSQAKWTVISLGVTTVATVAGILFSFWQIMISQRSIEKAQNANEIANRAIKVGQRAYISVKGLTISKVDTGDGVTWTFSPEISNDGNSPARNLRYRFGSHLYVEPDQDVEGEQQGLGIGVMLDFFKPGAQINKAVLKPRDPALMIKNDDGTHIFLASKATTLPEVLGVVGVSERFLKDHFARRLPYYVLGQFDYDDIFDPLDHHVTKFCFQIHGDFRAKVFVPKTAFCEQWNCADEECADQTQ